MAALPAIDGLEALLSEFKGNVLRAEDGAPFQQALQVCLGARSRC